jgi:Ribonuclease G/E
MAEEGIVELALKQTKGLLHSEDILVEAVRDLVKDEIKRYVREKLEGRPELKEELKAAVAEMMEAKIKEAAALVKMAKAGAKLGLELVPPHLREEVTKDLVGMFEKEISVLMEKTL